MHGPGEQQTAQAQARIPSAHEPGGLPHAHRLRIGAPTGQAVVSGCEPSGRLHLLAPEDHGIGVPVLGDDGQRARLCRCGTAGLGSRGAAGLGRGTAGNRPIAVATPPGDDGDAHGRRPPDGSGLQAQEAGGIEIARSRGEDSVGEVERHRAAAAPASRPAGLGHSRQTGEGAGLQGRASRHRVEGPQHARVVEPAPASGQRRHQCGGGDGEGAQVLGVVEAGRQQGAAVIQVRGHRRLQACVLSAPLGDQVVPDGEHGADVGGQARSHLRRQAADAPLEHSALGVQDRSPLIALQVGDESVQGVEQPIAGQLYLLVKAAQPLQGLDEGIAGPGDGRCRKAAQAHERGEQRDRPSGASRRGRVLRRGSGCGNSGNTIGRSHSRGTGLESSEFSGLSGFSAHQASTPLTMPTTIMPSQATPNTVPTTLSSAHARP